MNSASYLKIEEILKDNPRGDVKVSAIHLRDMFRAVRNGLRCQGILGFNAAGHPILNDVGMVALIKSVASEEFEHLGTMVSCNVSTKAWACEWTVNMVFAAPNGTSATISRTYSLSYLEEKRKFEYQMP